MNLKSVFQFYTGCFNTIMRLILYEIIYSVIHQNQHCPFKIISLCCNTFGPANLPPLISQLVLGSWWRQLQPSERCKVFENDSPWLSILILETSENHKTTFGEYGTYGIRGMHLFARNSWTDNAVCAGALWWSSMDPVVCNFVTNSHYPLSQTVHDFKKKFLIHCDTRRYKFFMNYPARIENNGSHFLWLLVCSCDLSWRLWRVPFLTLLLDFRVIFKKSTFVTCYDPIKKILFIFEPFKHFCPHFVSTRFLIVIQIFGTIFAHAFLMLETCVTIWWTIHSLILSSSAIIQIVKRPSWRMKALTRMACVLVPTGARRLDSGSFSTVSRPSTKYLCNRNTWALDRESLPNAFW
jgi:hypothetical protein